MIKVKVSAPVGAADDAVMFAVSCVPALLICILLTVKPEPLLALKAAPVRFCPAIVILAVCPCVTELGVMPVMVGAAVLLAAELITKAKFPVTVWLPEITVTVTVAPADDVATVGVPEITPVAELILKPVGRPETDHTADEARLVALTVWL